MGRLDAMDVQMLWIMGDDPRGIRVCSHSSVLYQCHQSLEDIEFWLLVCVCSDAVVVVLAYIMLVIMIYSRK